MKKERGNHCLGVGKKLQEMAMEVSSDSIYHNEMFLLGYLHDIGYQFTDCNDKHAQIGGDFLKSQGYKYWKEVYYHGQVDSVYSSRELDMLNKADMQVDSKGINVTLSQRLEDIGKRYGKESNEYKNSKRIIEEFDNFQ